MAELSITFSLSAFNSLRIHKLCETSDGGYVASGECNNPQSAIISGFLVKFDRQGNKKWEKTFDTPVYSCMEKSTDLFYLGTGIGGACKLYLYDLKVLTILSPSVAITNQDLQLAKVGTKLYRTLLDVKPDGHETVRLLVYDILK